MMCEEESKNSEVKFKFMITSASCLLDSYYYNKTLNIYIQPMK